MRLRYIPGRIPWAPHPHLNLQACSVCPVCCTDCRTQAAGTTCKQTSEGFTQNYNNKGENRCYRCLFISEKNSEIDMPHLHIHFVSAGSERAKYFEIISEIGLPHFIFQVPYSSFVRQSIALHRTRTQEPWVVAHALYSYNAKPPVGFEACRRSGVIRVLCTISSYHVAT